MEGVDAMTGYYRGEPNEYVIKYVGGKRARAGRGLSFLYWGPRTSVVSVPMNSQDAEFAFTEVTSNFQEVTVQGTLSFRVMEPERLAALLDYTIDPVARTHLSRDPPKLSARLISVVQEATRAEIQRLALEDAVRRSGEVARAVLLSARRAAEVKDLGVELLALFVNSLRPTPQVSKALEAEYRELLLKKADKAIHDRREAAVTQERTIREAEMGTEISVEGERTRLVELRAANLEREAAAQGRATRDQLAPFREIDPRVLLALGMKALGENAGKISNLNITPDLLSLLLRGGSAEE
jgi:regulator of protease activity HflC (stomatin/prohibitin superfamily)